MRLTLWRRIRPHLRENWYRDVWLFVITVILLFAVMSLEAEIERSRNTATEAKNISTRVARVEREQDKGAAAAVVDACIARNDQARNIIRFVTRVSPARHADVEAQFPREPDCANYAKALLSGKAPARRDTEP